MEERNTSIKCAGWNGRKEYSIKCAGCNGRKEYQYKMCQMEWKQKILV